MAKQFKYGEDARRALERGVNMLDTVKSQLARKAVMLCWNANMAHRSSPMTVNRCKKEIEVESV